MFLQEFLKNDKAVRVTGINTAYLQNCLNIMSQYFIFLKTYAQIKKKKKMQFRENCIQSF